VADEGQTVVKLKDIGREQVLDAVAEYDRLGREAFLRQHGYDRARQYVLVHDGKPYDSKAIVGVAHGFLPGEKPLISSEFSGGEATVGRLLRTLGFTVQVGDGMTADKLVRTLARLQVHRDAWLPALYQPITLLWAFGRARRGEPRLTSWPETQSELAALFKRYGRTGQGDRVFYPIAALYGAGLWELDAVPDSVPAAHGSSVPRRWFEQRQPSGGLVPPVYDLVHESAEARAAAVRAVVDNFFVDAEYAELLAEVGLAARETASSSQPPRAELRTEYRRLCGDVDIFWSGKDSARAQRTSATPIRSRAARDAVILRCRGRCENPCCNGDIEDLTDGGDPIVEVDHIHDLAVHGPDSDNPAIMIALCPNCHAIKTHGSTRGKLKETLIAEARRLHDEWQSAERV
jgi:5-methylcytosine-specific restriction protein A